MIETTTYSPQETTVLGQKIGSMAFGSMLILLDGDLGCGKTLLTKAIAEGLGITQMVSSPTYTIVQSYDGSPSLHHFDLYRLSSEDEFYEIGGYEYLGDDTVCVFEWPDRVDWSQYPRLVIHMVYIDETTRRISLIPHGQEYIDWLHRCHIATD